MHISRRSIARASRSLHTSLSLVALFVTVPASAQTAPQPEPSEACGVEASGAACGAEAELARYDQAERVHPGPVHRQRGFRRRRRLAGAAGEQRPLRGPPRALEAHVYERPGRGRAAHRRDPGRLSRARGRGERKAQVAGRRVHQAHRGPVPHPVRLGAAGEHVGASISGALAVDEPHVSWRARRRRAGVGRGVERRADLSSRDHERQSDRRLGLPSASTRTVSRTWSRGSVPSSAGCVRACRG